MYQLNMCMTHLFIGATKLMEDCGFASMLPTCYWKFACNFMIFAWLVSLVCRKLIMNQMFHTVLMSAVIDVTLCRHNMDPHMHWNPLNFASKPQTLKNEFSHRTYRHTKITCQLLFLPDLPDFMLTSNVLLLYGLKKIKIHHIINNPKKIAG